MTREDRHLVMSLIYDAVRVVISERYAKFWWGNVRKGLDDHYPVDAPATPTKQESFMTSEQTELRLRCLELAVKAGAPELRDQFLDFVIGKSDQTPREAIDAALDQAGINRD